MTKFGCHVIVLAYFWYFKLIFIFRGPIYGLFELFTNIWQPWKWNLTSYYCSGSLKTHESEFYFSGLPNFDNQGCHISLGRNCTNSIPAQDNGQITSLKHPTVGIHGKFSCTFFTLVSWTVNSWEKWEIKGEHKDMRLDVEIDRVQYNTYWVDWHIRR